MNFLFLAARTEACTVDSSTSGGTSESNSKSESDSTSDVCLNDSSFIPSDVDNLEIESLNSDFCFKKFCFILEIDSSIFFFSAAY